RARSKRSADSAGDLAGLGDVGPHLVEELLDPSELAGGPESGEEVDFQPAAIEVAGIVDQVDFDGPGVLAEGGVGADVGRGGPEGGRAFEEGAGGVDGIGGDLGVDPPEVGGREAEPRPSAGAADD